MRYVSIDRPDGVIRRGKNTDSAAHEGAQLREGLIDLANTASEVWADSAYRSAANERFLDKAGKVSRIHHKKPAKPNATRRLPGQCGQIKDGRPRRACLCRTEGPDGPVHSYHRHRRAEAAITLANMAYNMKRRCWLDGRIAPA